MCEQHVSPVPRVRAVGCYGGGVSDWLVENGPWIFSGLGAAAVVALARWVGPAVVRRLRRHTPNHQAAPTPGSLWAGRDLVVQQTFLTDLAAAAEPSSVNPSPTRGNGDRGPAARTDPIRAHLEVDTARLTEELEDIEHELRAVEEAGPTGNAGHRRNLRREAALARADLDEHFFVQQQLRRAIGQLSERDQVFLGLYYFEGMTFEQVGEVLGVGPELIERRVHQLLLKLRAVLG
jgi:RNA polymerase sigma factor (sigma-70 family)